MTETLTRADLVRKYLDLTPEEKRMVLVGAEIGCESPFFDVIIVTPTRIEPMCIELAKFMDDM